MKGGFATMSAMPLSFIVICMLSSAAGGRHSSEELPLRIRHTMQPPLVIGWDRVVEAVELESLIRVTALVNNLHNSSHDEMVNGDGRSGTIKVPHGWLEVRSKTSAGNRVGLLQAQVELFLCPRDYELQGQALRLNSAEMLEASGCQKAAERDFRVLDFQFRAGEQPVVIHIHLPFVGVRDQILSALPAQTTLPNVNRVFDFVKSVAFAFIETVVVPDDVLVAEWFGGDEDLQENLQILCGETMPDPAGLEEAGLVQTMFGFHAPTYAHKLGALLMAVSAFQLELCVETGSHLGETAFHLAAACKSVFTVELSASFASRFRDALPTVRRRFGRNVTLLEGNSGELLWDPRIQLDARPALFWLDGHYSAGTTARLDPAEHRHFASPVLDELRAVFARRNERDVIVIDDARDFLEPAAGFPSLYEVLGLVCQEAPGWRVQVRDDTLRLYKARAAPYACSTYGSFSEDFSAGCSSGDWGDEGHLSRDLANPPEL